MVIRCFTPLMVDQFDSFDSVIVAVDFFCQVLGLSLVQCNRWSIMSWMSVANDGLQ